MQMEKTNQKKIDSLLMRDSVIFHTEKIHDYGVKQVLKNVGTHGDAPNVGTDPRVCPSEISTAGDIFQHIRDSSEISTLENLKTHIGDCTRCPLHKRRQHVVFGEGNPKADLMFVGEGPGADEDEQGLPFVGRAGQLLTKMIHAMGYQRKDVYIGNIVKCRPPNNRNPEPVEIETCFPFLKKQIEIISPKVIVCLGKFAAQMLLETQIPISRLRGKFQDKNGIAIMPTFHPSYLLRSPEMKKYVWEDLKQVMARLAG